jgi:hypothetical protein
MDHRHVFDMVQGWRAVVSLLKPRKQPATMANGPGACNGTSRPWYLVPLALYLAPLQMAIVLATNHTPGSRKAAINWHGAGNHNRVGTPFLVPLHCSTYRLTCEGSESESEGQSGVQCETECCPLQAAVVGNAPLPVHCTFSLLMGASTSPSGRSQSHASKPNHCPAPFPWLFNLWGSHAQANRYCGHK